MEVRVRDTPGRGLVFFLNNFFYENSNRQKKSRNSHQAPIPGLPREAAGARAIVPAGALVPSSVTSSAVSSEVPSSVVPSVVTSKNVVPSVVSSSVVSSVVSSNVVPSVVSSSVVSSVVPSSVVSSVVS